MRLVAPEQGWQEEGEGIMPSCRSGRATNQGYKQLPTKLKVNLKMHKKSKENGKDDRKLVFSM